MPSMHSAKWRWATAWASERLLRRPGVAFGGELEHVIGGEGTCGMCKEMQ